MTIKNILFFVLSITCIDSIVLATHQELTQEAPVLQQEIISLLNEARRLKEEYHYLESVRRMNTEKLRFDIKNDQENIERGHVASIFLNTMCEKIRSNKKALELKVTFSDSEIKEQQESIISTVKRLLDQVKKIESDLYKKKIQVTNRQKLASIAVNS